MKGKATAAGAAAVSTPAARRGAEHRPKRKQNKGDTKEVDANHTLPASATQDDAEESAVPAAAGLRVRKLKKGSSEAEHATAVAASEGQKRQRRVRTTEDGIVPPGTSTAEGPIPPPAAAEPEIGKKKLKKSKSGEAADAMAVVIGGEKVQQRSKAEGKPTVSIAVAGSIMHNVQKPELATLLAGQIARAAAIFRIDEIVVFDNKSVASSSDDGVTEDDADAESGPIFLVRILQYMETPQYLRRQLFPMQKNLRFVGLLPPLDAPHHLRMHEWYPFREGVTLDGDNSSGTAVNVGLSKNVLVEEMIEPGKRVTVAMGSERDKMRFSFEGCLSIHP